MSEEKTVLSASAAVTDGYKRGIVWQNLIVFILLHATVVLAFFPMFFSWWCVLAVVVLWWITGGLGVTLGYHRLLTHRSFQTPKIVEYMLTLFGTLSWQGSPSRWVGTHRLHHAASDEPGDPHSPRDGFTWSHILWCVYNDHPDRDPLKAALDLKRDPIMRVIDNLWFVPQAILGLALFFTGYMIGGWIGAWSWLIWGVAVRVVFIYHATWFVNSAAHSWGYRNFKTTDDSRNNWWVALISFGEGWHNNHHAQQRSAAHGMRWWEFDMTYLTILAMEKLGLAWQVVRPKRPVGKPITIPSVPAFLPMTDGSQAS